MKTNLFYFSATGNSLIVARDIAAELPEAQIFSIAQVIDGEIDQDADNIGIIFPEYYSGIPRIISDFIRKLDPAGIKYLFAVCTYGGLPLNTLQEIHEQLRAAGIPLNAGYAVQMPGNYIVKYGAFNKEKQDKIFRKEKESVRGIAADVRNQKNAGIKPVNFLFNKIGKSIYRAKLPQFRALDRNFTANEKCTGCGVCEKICPVQNIRIEEKKPHWQGNCEHCLACIQWCPTEAIEYSTVTAGRERYRHPGVKAPDLYRQE